MKVYKSILVVWAIVFLLTLSALFVGDGLAPRTEAAKGNKTAVECVSCDIDAVYRPVIGQRGFYQLTDEEGGVGFNAFGQLEPFGRKVPGVITALQFLRNPDGSIAFTEDGRLQILRDESGTVVVCVQVARPGPKGGTFDRCGAVYGSRDPGGFDIPQPADKVGF